MSPAAHAPPAAVPVWRRLAVRLAVAFALLTFVSVAIVGGLVRERQKRELEDAVTDGDCQRAAASSLAGNCHDDGNFDPDHLAQVVGDGFSLSALFGT